jgi:hypothetical protein
MQSLLVFTTLQVSTCARMHTWSRKARRRDQKRYSEANHVGCTHSCTLLRHEETSRRKFARRY